MKTYNLLSPQSVDYNKAPMFIRILYWFSVVLFVIFFCTSVWQNASIIVRGDRLQEKETTSSKGRNYTIETVGNYTLVKFGGEKGFGVLNLSTGNLVKDTSFMLSDDGKLIKITPNFIREAKPSKFDYFFTNGVNRDKVMGPTNPPVIVFVLLPLIVAVFSHIIHKSSRNRRADG